MRQSLVALVRLTLGSLINLNSTIWGDSLTLL